MLGILLARLLTPADYGVVGMTSIFFALASIFIDGGLGTALIRKQNISEEDALKDEEKQNIDRCMLKVNNILIDIVKYISKDYTQLNTNN